MGVTKYVVGFAFNLAMTQVVLVHKLRPKWQLGLYNGVGGHVEEGETYAKAQAREFLEETGVEIDLSRWLQVGHQTGGDYSMGIFSARCTDQEMSEITTTTDETVSIHEVADVLNGKLLTVGALTTVVHNIVSENNITLTINAY